jgi:hypothetical protein
MIKISSSFSYNGPHEIVVQYKTHLPVQFRTTRHFSFTKGGQRLNGTSSGVKVLNLYQEICVHML